MESVNSTTFIKRPPYMTDIQEKFLYTKELLSGRLFLGHYKERRYISVLNEYRDVVVVSVEETDLLSDLDKLKKKLSDVQGLKWVGITGPEEFGFPNSYCFCVKLTNLPFGQYWFQIRHVKLVEQEIFFQLKCIRRSVPSIRKIPMEVNMGETSETKSDQEEVLSSKCPSSDISNYDPKNLFSAFQESCIKTISAIKPFISWGNFILCLRVGCGLIIVLAMGAISAVGHLGEFVLKLIREFSFLVNAFTPIVIQLIELLSKVIGGLFILTTRLFGIGHQPNFQLHRAMFHSTQNPDENIRVDWRERNRNLRRELLSNTFHRI